MRTLLRILLIGAVAVADARRSRQTYQDINDDGSSEVQITIYPTEAEVRDGRSVAFDCRARTADNSKFLSTRWTRVGGPLPSSAQDTGGRLVLNPVAMADAGTYVCVTMHQGRTVEAIATLNVLSYGPQELQGHATQTTGQCMADEKACGNNECIKLNYVCDGEPDCRDRSDEQNCPSVRQCEPNEFKCNNQRCVQKMWLCDGDDDCGDNSDELNCGGKKTGDICQPTEFKCQDGKQCVPASFHCDGTSDCQDGSDEVGCMQPTVVEPPETNRVVPQGSSFSLSCKAVAVPEPYINWRLNWGPVCDPPRCQQSSEGGRGTLTITDAQPTDQGAYTCEAINVKGRVLATPDCVVRVQPEPYPQPQQTPPPPPPPAPEPSRPPCQCYNHSPRGCDSFGRCLLCEHSTEGNHCERCKKGYYGDATKGTPYDCTPCPCPGTSDCYLDSQGQVSCRNCPAGLDGNLCNECAPGYTRSNRPSGRQCEPIGSITPQDRTYVPPPPEVGHPPQPSIDPPHQVVNEGEPASFRCWVPGIPDCQVQWHKERIGGGLPHGVYQTGNALKIPQAQMHDAGSYICTAINQFGQGQSPPGVLEVVRPAQKPKVDPPMLTVNEGEPARFRCWVPGNPEAQLRWSRPGNGPLPPGAQESQGILHIPRTSQQDTGEYVCTATDPRGGPPQMSDPVRLDLRRPEAAIAPQVDPPVQTVNEGEPARIRCWVPGNPNVHLRWSKSGRRPLPAGAHEQGGHLTIPRTQKADEGDYICTATDPNNNRPIDASPARVNVVQAAPLRPMVDPAEQTVPEGSPFRIRCWVPGQPDVQLTWRKASGQLSDDSDQDDGILSVGRSEMSDEGDYVCSARDPSTGRPVDSSPATVHVTPAVTAPVVESQEEVPEISPPVQTVNVGEPARITCTVRGRPHPRLSFRRADSRPMPLGSADHNGVLDIPTAQATDAGQYICLYRPDDRRPAKQTTPSVLNVESPGEPPKPVATPPILTVKRGEPARFHCDAHSPTPARIRWTFGDNRGSLPRGVSQEGDDVVVDASDDAHVGDYICTATNAFGSGTAEPVQLRVTDDEQPPTARVEPRTWNGNPGERHQFRCIVTGSPTPKITWTGPDGRALPEDVTPLEPNLLDFSNGRSEHNGDYTCTATNPVGEASDHGTVNIGPQLKLTVSPPGPRLILTVGEPLEVRCEATGGPGDPDPEVEWLHDPGPERGDLPDDFKPVTISEQFIRHPSIGLLNAGTFTCKGSSTHATATKNIYVEVVEPSKVATVSILGGSSQWFEQGEPAELVCTATGSSLVDRLEWVKVDGQLPSDVEEHNEAGILHFPGFKNSYAGDYECRGYRNNELIASGLIHVHGASDADDEPRVEIEPPRVRIVAQGESIVLKCSVEGAKNGANFKWALLRGGSLVRQLGKEATLQINKADPGNDFGVYRCNVEDDNGIVVGSAYTAVSVGFQSQNNAQTVKFEEKADATLTCPVFAVPGSKVEWRREGGELPANAVPGGAKIEFKNFDDSSSGLYVCRVSFESGAVEGYVHAQIFVPDTIIQVLLEASSESPEIGQRAWLDCKVTGDPSAVITWSKEGSEELPSNAQVTGGRLLFTDVSENNAGVYRCIAKTKAGPLQTRTVLNVGSSKRRRKHTRRGRRMRHRRRNAEHARRAATAPRQPSTFGSWFSSGH